MKDIISDKNSVIGVISNFRLEPAPPPPPPPPPHTHTHTHTSHPPTPPSPTPRKGVLRSETSYHNRVLACPKFLPTDSDLCTSRIRCIDHPCPKNVIVHIIFVCWKVHEMIQHKREFFVSRVFFLKKKIIPVLKLLPLKLLHITAKCGKSVWPYMKRMVYKQKGKIRQNHWMS